MRRSLLTMLLVLATPGCSGGGGGGDGDADADADADTDADADADTDADADADADADGDGDGDADGDADPVDPLDLALDVSRAELETTIADLVAFGTRYTYTTGDDDARAYVVARLEDLGLPVEEDEFTVTGEPCANVIGRKAGVEEPDVVWIFSSHYDSTSTSPESDAPGADDNATGVAGVLEAARLLAPLRLRQSVWFVLTAAEEQGSLGSQHLAGRLVQDDVDVRGVIAPDMIGYWPLGDADSFDILGDGGSQDLVSSMASVADALGVAHKDWNNHGYCYGDDHTNFQEAGFAAISPMDCVEAHNLPGSGEQTPHYHRRSDTIDTLAMPFTTRVVQVIVGALATWAEPL